MQSLSRKWQRRKTEAKGVERHNRKARGPGPGMVKQTSKGDEWGVNWAAVALRQKLEHLPGEEDAKALQMDSSQSP